MYKKYLFIIKSRQKKVFISHNPCKCTLNLPVIYEEEDGGQDAGEEEEGGEAVHQHISSLILVTLSL
jgi:hypothetical protein